MASSLGFNINRKHRTTNLSGGTGVSVTLVRTPVVLPVRRTSSSKAAAAVTNNPSPAPSSSSFTPTAPLLRPTVNASRTKQEEKPSASSLAPSPFLLPETTPPPASEHVYATVARTLYDASSSTEGKDPDEASAVALPGERVVLVYPMREHGPEARVVMRLKTCHPVTGQLSYRWVTVYDHDESSPFVKDFSLLP